MDPKTPECSVEGAQVCEVWRRQIELSDRTLIFCGERCLADAIGPNGREPSDVEWAMARAVASQELSADSAESRTVSEMITDVEVRTDG